MHVAGGRLELRMYPSWHRRHLGPTDSRPVQARSGSSPAGQYAGCPYPVQLAHTVGADWLHLTMYWCAWHGASSWHDLHSREF